MWLSDFLKSSKAYLTLQKIKYGTINKRLAVVQAIVFNKEVSGYPVEIIIDDNTTTTQSRR